MRLRGLAIVLAILLVPVASAGSERRPDVVDDVGDGRGRSTDILSAWLAGEERGLRFSIQVAQAESERDYGDHIYWVLFTIEETGREVAAAVGYGNDGVLRGHLTSGTASGGLDGRDSSYARGGFERIANAGVVGLRAHHGSPGVFSGVIPWGAFAEFEPGVVLAEWGVGNTRFERSGAGWTGLADGAESPDPFVAAIHTSVVSRMTGGLLPILVPAWMLPSIVILCACGGIAAGYGASRIARAKEATRHGAATIVPVRTAPPPGSRFQRAPPPEQQRPR